MVKFIQIADLHVVPEGALLYGTDPGERLARCIDSVLAEHADATCCVATGDLINDHPPAAYRRLAEQFARLPMPVHPILGNHDHREHFRAAFPGVGVDANGFVQYEAAIGAHRALFLDTHEPGAEHGVYCAKRASWLAARLAEDDRPVLLFMHHPPMPLGLPAMDRIALRDPAPLLWALAGHEGRIRHLFLGHVHRALSGSWRGIAFSSLRGTNHQVALCMQSTGDEVMGSHEAPQYAVVLVGDDQVTVHLHDFMQAGEPFVL
jgi:3',5'-cyclic AMP phosphodiesterase CpdA